MIDFFSPWINNNVSLRITCQDTGLSGRFLIHSQAQNTWCASSSRQACTVNPPCGFGGWRSWKLGLLDTILPGSKFSSSFSTSILSLEETFINNQRYEPFWGPQSWPQTDQEQELWCCSVLVQRRRPHLYTMVVDFSNNRRMIFFLLGHLAEYSVDKAFEGVGLAWHVIRWGF